MTRRQTLFLVFLTALYLSFELAFNARLLDLVGGANTPDQIHNIEIFGRSLSGIAVALVVLQLLVSRQQRTGNGELDIKSIALWCGGAILVTYISLQWIVDILVDSRTPEFRHASTSMVLVQRALVSDNELIAIDGLSDRPGLFSRPEGKAFLALFPAMAIAVERLDMKIRDVKLALIRYQIEKAVGGIGGYHASYVKATKAIRDKWGEYRRGAEKIREESMRRQDHAWYDYVANLRRRGWSPSTVPGYAQDSVARNVRKSVPVPQGWHPADEGTFRAAVDSQVRKKVGDGSVVYNGQRIPAGMSYEAFYLHPAIQLELRDKLKLPKSVTLRPDYETAEKFRSLVYEVMLDDKSSKELEHYDEPASTYSKGGKNEQYGQDAARAVLVPPFALLCSLLGAVLHLSKLFYLLAKFIAESVPSIGRRLTYPIVVPAMVLALVWGAFTIQDNEVTESRVFKYMQGQIRQFDHWSSPLLSHLMHVVAVGQGLGYPLNEFVRVHVLQGISYGYVSDQK